MIPWELSPVTHGTPLFVLDYACGVADGLDKSLT